MKKIWKYLSGKKRNIGILLYFGVKLIRVFKPHAIPDEAWDITSNIIDALLIGGVTHAFTKTDKAKIIINNSLKNLKSWKKKEKVF